MSEARAGLRGLPLSAAAAVGVSLLAALALAVGRSEGSWTLPADLVLAVASVLLAVVDLREQRLPNRGVAATFVAELVLLGIAAAGSSRGTALVRALLAAAVVFAVLLLLNLLAPSGIGMGDVKLGAVVGLVLGYRGWTQVLDGLLAAFVLQALVTIALLVARRAGRGAGVAFGPALLAGVWLSLSR